MKPWIAFVFSLALSAKAAAYDSPCYYRGEPCKEGPQTARGTWIGASDEHRELFDMSMTFAGLPASTKEVMLLDVYTDGSELLIDGESLPSLIPADFSVVASELQRGTYIAEFAQLPDFAYSLVDWALGLETCPVDDADAERCHLFKGHMGTLNSNHFLPQAAAFYDYYHQLALLRANECGAMSSTLGDERSRFERYLLDCEKEALLLEAIGHHFLQDAWSSGHMWERWGSPNLSDFSSLLRGAAVAATSGIIHGARALLQPEIAPAVSQDMALDVNDAMCAPHPEVEWVHSSLGRQPGLGDLYLSSLLEDGRFVPQHDRLFACAVASIRAVYEATGQQHGPLQMPTGPTAESLDPSSPECFGQRVTNRALDHGFGIDYTAVDGTEVHLAITPSLAGSMVLGTVGGVLGTAGAADADEQAVLGAELAFDLAALSFRLGWNARFHPLETSMAEGGIGTLAGVDTNSVYMTTPPADYVDPTLPWRLTAGGADAEPTTALLRAFHRAHASDWCDAFSSGVVDLDDLSARVGVLTTAIEGLPEGDPTRLELEASRTDACTMCGEFVQRHLRMGTGQDAYDTSREPLCTLLDPSAVVVYADALRPEVGAARYCGCPVAVCDGSFSQQPVVTILGQDGDDFDAPTGPLQGTRIGGDLNMGTATMSADFGELSGEVRIDIDGVGHGGNFARTGWTDWLVVTPEDGALASTSGMLVGEVALEADGSANWDPQDGTGRSPHCSARLRVGNTSVLEQGDANTDLVSNRTVTVEVPISFGVPSRLRTELDVGGGFLGTVQDPAAGRISVRGSARWVRVVEIRDAVGTPVPATWCSLSGYAW